MKPIHWMLAALAALLAQGRSEACGFTGPPPAMIHTALPRVLPKGAIVAKVRFESTDVLTLVGPGIRARVIRMIQGPRNRPYLIVRPALDLGLCGDSFGNGRSGFIVAVPRGYEDGILVVHPIHVPVGTMLPNRCRVTPELAEAVALPQAGAEERDPPQTGQLRMEDLFLPDICEGR